MGAYESGVSLKDLMLSKLPEADRAAAKAIFEKAEAKDAVTLLGDSALARSDYSKSMDDLRKREGELEDWWQQNPGALDEYVVMKPEYDKLKATTTTTTTTTQTEPPIDPRKAVQDELAVQGRDYLAVANWIADIREQHREMFGERLDTAQFLNDPRLGKQVKGAPEGRVVSLPDLYQEKFGEKVAAKAKELEDKRINDLAEEKYKARLAETTRSPFPLRGEASVLDVLQDKDGPAKHTLDSAVAHYEALQQNRA